MKRIAFFMLLIPFTLQAEVLPCPTTSKDVVTFTQGSYSDCTVSATQVNISSGALISNSHITATNLTTSENVTIENSTIQSTVAQLAQTTTIKTSSLNTTQLCLNPASGTYSFSGSTITGIKTNASKSSLDDMGATEISFNLYRIAC